MGESAVLVHSYSFAAPLSRNDSHEDDTIHALSQSISFGKFVTENLEWGKWSSFSHKKYVEEAEKYSRPGSVAQKKAFFEAHYKRIAEAKKAATEEQPSVTPAQLLLHTLETQQEEDDDDTKSVHLDHDHDDSDAAVTVDDDVIDQKKPARKSITKNKPVFRLSLEKTIPPSSIEPEISVADNIISPKPISSEKNDDKLVHRPRFSLLSCFTGSAKAQDHNQISKKKKKQYLCLCLKPKTVRES